MSVIGMVVLIVTATTIVADGRRFGVAAATRTLGKVRGLNLGQKFLPTAIATKVKSLSITFSAGRRRFIHRHSANWVFGHCCPSIFRDRLAMKSINIILYLACRSLILQ
jgi:hypothetical protein